MNRTTVISTLFASAVPFAAFAHASLTAPQAKVDSAYVAVLQVPHGCQGEATTEIDVKLPEGFVDIKPMPKPDWTIELVQGKYAGSHDLNGSKITEGPVEIRWKNGNLPDDYSEEFAFAGRFSGVAAGTIVPFVMTQHCGDKTVVWGEVAKHGQHAHDLEHPAPVVELVGGKAADAIFEPVKVGDLLISSAAIKAMTPGQPVAGGFVTVINTGKADDRLVSVTTDRAGRVELHHMILENEIMKMRQLKDGLPMPAGQTVEMKPGGLHIMFMGVKERFQAGQSVRAVLTFEKAGKVEITLPVKTMKPGMDHGKM